ncbi:hypothetical protein BK130_04890 [Viridibacillus sp. FSL H8-0123]|nr:hypothetical protein BK130_04890 [Viridibacillus sp. FSL H8-0123]OMC88375.1 hypothetical protein BK128_00010 [Viridibacillus sp. FSL H7-0596]OMC93014.1 hypothetical protein BK137_00330 [Viridibacillus arenosi]
MIPLRILVKIIIRTSIRLFKVSKAFSNLLKYIDKIPHAKKEQAYQWFILYVELSSSVVFEMTDTYNSRRLSKFVV